jgi:muramoyltetrapeptide carboxypeptidase
MVPSAREARMKIGIVAPANRMDPAVAERVKHLMGEIYANRATLEIHPQCFLSSGHFAGDDQARAAAFVEVANDPSIDAVWFARGGYGSCRILELALPKLTDAAKKKTYLGYSDMGSLLGALYTKGFPHLVHGPMPSDIARQGGEAAVRRALAFLVERSPASLEPSIEAVRRVAFNIETLAGLIGTPYEPDLTGHVLMLEEIAEYMYRIDRSLFHIFSSPKMRKLAGLRLGRCSDVPANDPDFGKTEVEVAQYWCHRTGIPYLGRADIGHDADNKVVPFGGAVTA